MNNFPVDQVEVIIARALLLIQLIAIFPLIMYIWRHAFLALFGFDETMFAIIAINCLVVTICISVAIFYPYIGTVIRYTGAICGFVMIFFLPCLCEMTRQKYESRIGRWSTFAKVHWMHFSIHVFIILLGLANMVAQFVPQ